MQLTRSLPKNKRTASVADSQQKRVLNNLSNITTLSKENTYRNMSVTPSHKYHETKKDKFLFEPNNQTKTSKVFQTPNHRGINNVILKNNTVEPPKYKNSSRIEEVKDEYNESKVSFNITEENEQGSGTKVFDIDLEALILVEDKICSLTPHVISEYYDVTSTIYKNLSDQFDLITEDAKHLKTLKTTLVLEVMVVIIVTLLGDDPKLAKGTLHQFKNLNYYIHQNILLLIDVIIDKLPNPK